MDPIKMMYGSMFVLQFFWETWARTSEEIFPWFPRSFAFRSRAKTMFQTIKVKYWTKT